MSFDPKIADVLKYANNFFASAYPIIAIIVGIAIAAFALGAFIRVFRRSSA